MQNGQGLTIWFTGMAGAGKRTLAAYIAPRLQMIGRRVEFLDGDDIRETLLGGGTPVQPGQGFDVEVKRLGFLAKMLTRNGVVAIATSISPFREAREELRKSVGRFVEIYVDCSIEKLMFERDKQGLYRLTGETPVPGHNAPYDVPASPDLKVDTGNERVEESAARIFNRLREMGYVTREEMEILAGGVEPPPLRSELEIEEPAQAKQAREKAKADREKAEARAKEAAKAPKAEKLAKAEKAEKAGKAERAEKPEKAPKSEAAAKPEKPARAEKPAKAELAARAEKAGKAPAKPAAKAPAKPERAPAKPAKGKAAEPPAKGAGKAKAAPRREAAKVVKPAPKAGKAPPAKAAKGKAKGKR